jgi:hypothetical protein
MDTIDAIGIVAVEEYSTTIIDKIYNELPKADESHLASVIISLEVNNT